MEIIAYFATALTIIGTVANSLQKRWCFIVWICTNAFWSIYNFSAGQVAQAALYIFNLIMAVVGLVKWGRQPKRAKTRCDTCYHKFEIIPEYKYLVKDPLDNEFDAIDCPKCGCQVMLNQRYFYEESEE